MTDVCTRRPARAPRALGALLAGALLGAAGPAHAADAGWKPERAVELIAVNAPGGGADRILRLMQNIIQTELYVPVPVNIVNKPGGGGAVAFTYLNQHPGDGHHLVMGGKTLITNNLIGRGPNFREFTPVVNLFNEYISVTVRPDSPIRDGRDLIERLRKDPAALSFGIATTLGNPNHQGVVVAFKQAGIDVRKMRTAVFQSGGAATTAMLGGHIDVVPITAAFAASMLRNGQVRLIAVSAPQRLPGVLAEVPTWREQGFDAVVSNWRTLVGPKGMAPAQVAYWEQAIKRFADAPDWKKELDNNFWSADFKGSADTRRQMERDEAEQRSVTPALESWTVGVR
jgi:putative tricarboxylic transport membrane protein